MLVKKQHFINSLIALTIILSLPNLASAAVPSKIGDTCADLATNDDCEYGGSNLDCEKSSAPGNPKFCTCWSADDCKAINGNQPPADGGEWECKNGGQLTYDLHYCYSSKMALGDYLDIGTVINPLTYPTYYCLVSDKSTSKTSCEPVPTSNGCSSYPNKFYLPPNLTPLGGGGVSKAACDSSKLNIDTGKFCNLNEYCVSSKLADCSSQGKLIFDTYESCTKSITVQSCKSTSNCPGGQYCIGGGCISFGNLSNSKQSCGLGKDADCKSGDNQGTCILVDPSGSPTHISDSSHPYCFYKGSINTAAPTTQCGAGSICTKSDKSCKDNPSACNTGIGKGICKDGFCWFDEMAMKQYNSGPTLLGIQASLKIQQPRLNIDIGGWSWSNFSNLASTTATEENGVTYLHIPYIGEYLYTLYKLAIAIASIIAVIMIVIEGVKITTIGGEQRVTGFKRIGQIFIGLFIAWGSYAILYNINPDLVTFQALKVKYIDAIPLEDLVFDEDTTPQDSNPKSFSATDYDDIFKKYAVCSGLNWQLMKAIAQHESGLNPSAKNPHSSATGLFQDMAGNNNSTCKKVLANVNLSSKCDSPGLTDPDLNTAYVSLIFNASVPTITNRCNTSFDNKVFMLYYGHASGPCALSAAISAFGCNPTTWPAQNWPAGTKCGLGGKPVFRGASKQYTDKIVGKIKGFGVTTFEGPKNSKACPIHK